MSRIIYKATNKKSGFFGTLKRNFDLNLEETEFLYTLACSWLTVTKKIKNPVMFLDSETGAKIAERMTSYAQKNAYCGDIWNAFTTTMEQFNW